MRHPERAQRVILSERSGRRAQGDRYPRPRICGPNPPRASREAQRRRRVRLPGSASRLAVDGVEEVPGARRQRCVGRADVVRHAGVRRADHREGAWPRRRCDASDGVVDEGAGCAGIGHGPEMLSARHQAPLQPTYNRSRMRRIIVGITGASGSALRLHGAASAAVDRRRRDASRAHRRRRAARSSSRPR